MEHDLKLLRYQCPLPVLMNRLGLARFARNCCASPFRSDHHASWGIFLYNGRWLFKDFATDECGDEIKFLAKLNRLDPKQDFFKLLDLYAMPNATHPIPGGAASVSQVFLLPATDADATSTPPSPAAKSTDTGPQLAVVDLTGAFVANHPSGLETETLTVLSICATLHANLPRITQVRFMVDGQPRPTLAGHADLTRTYLTADAVPTEGVHP